MTVVDLLEGLPRLSPKWNSRWAQSTNGRRLCNCSGAITVSEKYIWLLRPPAERLTTHCTAAEGLSNDPAARDAQLIQPRCVTDVDRCPMHG